jgi:parvulin-like peptidyl-prolyl isomerase
MEPRVRLLVAFSLGWAALLLTAAAPAAPPAVTKAPPEAPAQLKDRVLAVVDEDPILSSDLDRVIALGLKAPKPGENDAVFRRRVLNDLIEERLRFHEIDRFGFEQVPVDEIDAHVAELRGSFKDEAAFQQVLKEHGLILKDVRQIVARQLGVLTYVDEQLGPRVFVGLDDINSYYTKVLTPEMKKRGQPVPPLDEVRDQIRGVLREQRLNEAIGKWTEELRRKADIQSYVDQPTGPLPPVVKKIQAPKKIAPPAKPAKKKP